jgi:uncharacterized protein YacL
MFRIEKRKFALVIGLGVVLLLICIAVVFVIDTHFSLNPWGDGDVEALWYFLVGSMFFPGALRRYRAGRQAERKVPWYHRLDLILCLIGLVFGLVFAESVVQKWFEFDLIHGIGSTHSPVFVALVIALITVYSCWIALVILLFSQMIKQIKQRKTEPPQTT